MEVQTVSSLSEATLVETAIQTLPLWVRWAKLGLPETVLNDQLIPSGEFRTAPESPKATKPLAEEATSRIWGTPAGKLAVDQLRPSGE